ncbi:hypothetical protein [Bradyrhizobium manausense]|uniref:ParB/Sulfiredoxin domain-containing protein n=1 Tax=Bradyrhizobium manausense TaxID=989370 RepID=A0A0R3DCA6_9BRAD|nr:hypothetical protein [Bradyrhizobium manausense]KRQ04924.1 hypothetical protein AOQ71_29165 [Bradyrhizobium manausense]
MAKYARNIQGAKVELELIEVDPDAVILDPTNPRVGFSIRQLQPAETSDAACALLLTSQEDTEALKRSIILSGGVQEPIYVRHDRTVAEGNRRVVALRAAREEFPQNPAFSSMPAWLIPEGTPEEAVQDLLNEIHLGSVRGWAPYEKALQMRALVKGGLIEAEVAERYRMTTNDVRQHIEAANLMDRLYFPIASDPTDAEHRTKFSYFLEFSKNGRIQRHRQTMENLPERFAHWVMDGRVDTGMKVRKLPKILDADEAVRLLEIEGFDAAEEYLAAKNPREQEFYLLMERTRQRLADMSVSEMMEAARGSDRLEVLENLRETLDDVLDNVRRVGTRKARGRRA